MLTTFDLLERMHKRLASIAGGMSLIMIKRTLTVYTVSSWRNMLMLALEDLNKIEEQLRAKRK
jgi:hypothetical protein